MAIAPESRSDLYMAWELVTTILTALMFLFVGLEVPRRLGPDLGATHHLLGTALAIGTVVILVRLVWVWPSGYLPLWLFPKLREREGDYPDPRGVLLAGWCGVRGAVSLAAAIAIPLSLPDGTPFPGRGEVLIAVLVTILLTLIGQASTLAPLVRWLGLPGDPTTAKEMRKTREAMLEVGIARLDEFCSDKSCPIAVYRYRDSMNDQLAELRALDESERRKASQRLAVSREVRRAVYEAQTEELLRLRDASRINDRTHQALQLELDREHADMREEQPREHG
jgi:CPA1 family monovalent cation:H+ antiporter